MQYRTPSPEIPRVLRLGMALLVTMTALFLCPQAFAQVSSGSLSGTVFDVSGAVIPAAHVVLKNDATNVLRDTVADGAGYFNFPAIEPGAYTLTISSQGFRSWEQREITFYQGENRTIPNIMMQLATTSQEVTVVASAAAAAPIDTGESRQTLNSHMISQLSIQGRDAAELLKLMPGVGMNTGLNQASWNSLTTGTNSGPIGSFTANGTQPNGGMSMTMDGAAIVDPGNQGTQIANINQDQTAEVTILNSAFGAEYAKGPVTFQAITKSGTSQFHGGAYMYGRNGSLNAEDSYLKNQGVPKPIDRYWYPGGGIGGPILIPGTNFNKDHNKAFFYAAFEYMNQHPEGYLRQSIVPSAEMLQGDFSQAVVSQFYGNSNVVPCNGYAYPSHSDPCGTATSPGAIVNGQIPASMFDPNSLILAKLLPPPNVNPATHNGNNFSYLDNPPQNRWEFRIRGDYSFNDNTKVYLAYGRQDEKDINNFGVWWWPGGTVPYPSQLPAQTIANDWSVNLVHVFSPTLTNETIFTYAYYINPVKLTNPSAVDPSTLGFTAKGVFNPAVTPGDVKLPV